MPTPAPTTPPPTTPPTPLTRARRAAFLAITLLVPFLLLGAVEVALRVAWPRGRLSLFGDVPGTSGAYRAADARVGSRWFVGEQAPPAPMAEPFAARKPERALRVFVLGESSTAGFPYPRNGTFTRVLRDMLRDVLPGDSVEVVNLGIAATNSYAMLDLAGEVLAERPDVVLVYAGHNEYYGALGVGSAQGAVGASPPLVRAYLRLLRLRTVLALREGIVRARDALAVGGGARDASEASLMESLAREQEIPLGGPTYARGVRQYEENLARLVRRVRAAGVPVLVGSLASNLRDQPPFASAANRAPGGAQAAFDSAGAALARGDTASARAAFVRARDLDVVRFRAPSAFDAVVRRVVDRHGATYVPVGEAFAAASPGGLPGRELLLEHVHPTRRGAVVIARAYFDALRAARLLRSDARFDRLRAPEAYDAAMALSPFDERVALHTVRTLQARWPFVPAGAQRDYRGSYRPTGLADSLALAVSRGVPWGRAKLELALAYERAGHPDSAAAEYVGLARDAPLADEPLRLLARALLQAGDSTGAAAALVRAFAVRPSGEVAEAIGRLALRRRDLPGGIAALERAVQLEPTRVSALYELSLAYGMARNLVGAQETARRVAALDPRHPGLAGWMQVIGLAPPGGR